MKYFLRVLITALTIVIGIQLYQTLTQKPLYSTAWGSDLSKVYKHHTPHELYIIIEDLELVWTELYTEFLKQLIASDFEDSDSDSDLIREHLKIAMNQIAELSEELYLLMLAKMKEPEPQKEPELLTPKYNI